MEGRLSNWQNATTSPTVTAKYLYDCEGARVVQQVVDSVAGTTTTTSYVGRLETYSITTSSGPTLITTTDYVSAGKVLAESVNGTLSYLATSYQGSVVEALDSTGNVGVTASQLYVPYGGIRYLSGALPTDYGYTGQRRDASSGLDYYGARYYDPAVGQFTSADTLLAGGLNRYGYVGGNPTTATDPSGHMDDEDPDEGGVSSDQGMTPEAMSGDVSPGGSAAASDGVVSSVNAVTDPALTYTTVDNGEYQGDPALLDGDAQTGTVTIYQKDGDTLTESQADFWQAQGQGSLDNPDPTQMGEDFYNEQRAQEGDTTTSTTTTTTANTPQTPETPSQPGNPANGDTTISATPSGTTVTTGSPNSGPYFQSTLSTDGTNYTMQMAYREGAQEHASDVFAKQFNLAGGDPAQLQQLTLENVEEAQTMEQWGAWDSLVGSTLDRMANHFANSIGINLGAPSWSGPDIVYPILP